MSGKNKINIRDKNFRREVGEAKTKYRKKRFTIFLTISLLILFVSGIRIYFFIDEKKQLDAEIELQKQEIVNLEKESKINEILIAKFKDPYFITDLARQEYSMSYPGEIIFNIPLRENFVENSIKNVGENTDINPSDNSNKIDEAKLEELLKKQRNKEKKEDNKNSNKET
ncbi:FtsB family cell division protein [Gemelliphila palaticanis]|uniref:Septum formation initiator family protein n=1 Tax=Gemelliphila palaticanis TaxID=81950 RepID=A0ABX2T4E1_9BACL|nr:septum formation initiator family protein [Gemella palaticanis]MBF0715946.1 septum formation initiator family protein [Gemella palaticanis]NYS47876.1 septum formation initiator family protein [Gemella palaticanis]